MDKTQKAQLVVDLNKQLKDIQLIVVCHYSGLNVAAMTKLRRSGRAANVTLKVVKNRLTKRALEGTDAAAILPLLEGPTILAYSQDPVAAAKVVSDFSNDNSNLVVLGGALGAKALDKEGVKALATLPSLDELRGRLIGMISTPATRIAQVVNAPAGQIARVISAHAKKNEAA